MKGTSPPSMDEFDVLIGVARKQARKSALKPSDIEVIIDEVRSRESGSSLTRISIGREASDHLGPSKRRVERPGDPL